VDLKDAINRIQQFETRVLSRKRWLGLQDAVALSFLVAGLLSAALVIYTRLRPLELRWWIGPAAILTAVTAIVMIRFLLTRATATEAAFAIDECMNLEDRLTSAQAILERGGPEKPVEIALVEDVASRLETARASTITPYRFPGWYALSMAALVVAGLAFVVPQTPAPGAQELAVERAEIQSAGEQLEQKSSDVERLAPSGSETAKLAREQAELGRALRRSLDSRAEVLRKLSTLQDRIRVRHDQLAETRADEVVTLAEQRLRSAVAEKPGRPADKSQPGADAAEIEAVVGETGASREKRAADGAASKQSEQRGDPGVERTSKGKDVATNAKSGEKSATEEREAALKNQTRPGEAGSKDAEADKADRRATDEKASQGSERAKADSQPSDAGSKSEPGKNPAGDGDNKAEPQSGAPDAQPQSEDKRLEVPSGLTGIAAEQAAKLLPSLSQQLLKKAAQLRANELKPEDIKQLQQAAQLLARDLEKFAQSKELQQTVEELSRQVKPEQLEQVARELANNEELKREMEAAAKLIIENQQTKQAVAGLAQQLAEQRDQFREQRGKALDQTQLEGDSPGRFRSVGGSGPTSTQGSPGGRYERGRIAERLNAKGREEKVSGRLQRGAGGEYLYLRAKPGAGASRTTYSSAYPQYRREAERSVERSQVPQRLRSVVRDYFDAINPDVAKKP
jgi:hypothetical protein